MSDSILAATGVSKSYTRAIISSVHLQDRILKWRLQRKRVTVHALQNTSLAVKKGEWIGIYGHNGSGKTTLLRLLAGLLHPDTGSIERHGSLSCFFELGIGFHPDRKAEENIYIHGLLQGYSPKEIRKMTQEILAFAGVDDFLDLPIKCYSTGMRMRLAYAAAAQVDRDIYLLDEVLTVGDEAFQEQCRMHLQSLKENGKTAILVSHTKGELEAVCDRILFMDHGRVVSEERMWDGVPVPVTV
ncbi:ABC transporter ATP-binding protein [Candidatus Peribacteria bacterium]|nr:MAG: ABC transporter ATP-binding protein [Candidatus Peribacteria bacterium]